MTRIFAGPNITLAPTNGLGQVTITANLSGSTSYNTATGSYGSFYDTTTQTNPVANIPRSMSFNTTDITNGVSLSGSTNPFNTYIKTENPGVYNIQFSAQLDKTDSGKDEVVIWLRKNGIDLTDTATTLTLNGNDDKVVAAWNWFTNSTANDYYQIIWYSADTDLRILAETAGGGHPGIPSVILTVNRVDTFLSNTGSFSGSFNGNFNGSGSGTFIGSFTGSLFGTASQAVSSSYAITSSFAPSYTLTSSFLAFTSSVNATTGALNATTGALNATTGALNATTGALNATTGALNSKTGSYATTGSNTFIGTQTITGNGTVTGDWTVQGNLTAQTIIISSSVSYFTESFSSGSTKFGDDTSDTHQFTGSVKITGSFEVTGSVTANYGFTGSLFGTSSWAQNTVGAPYYVLTSSFSTTSASISSRVTNLESTASAFVVASASFSSSIVTLTNASASLAINSGSNSTRFTVLELASGSLSASVATLINASSSFAAVSTSYSALSGSFRTGSYTGSFIGIHTGSLFGTASNAVSSSYALSASYASNVPLTASYALTASVAISSSYALSASYASNVPLTASYALTASQALSASFVNPLTQTVSINGGLNVTGSTNLSGSAGTTILSANIDTIVFSGSFTSTGSVTITGSLNVNAGITGSLLGTSSYAIQALSSSYVLSSSYATQALSASYALSSSYAITASFDLNTNAVGRTPVTHTQAASSSTWAVTHSLGSQTPLITIYDFGYNVIIPQNIQNTSINSSTVTFSSPQSGYAVFSVANQVVSGSTAVLSQSSAATTWSFSHNLNSRFVNVDVYGSDFSQVIPARLTLTNSASVEITFAAPTAGYAVTTINGFSGSVTSTQNTVVQTDGTNATRYITFTDTLAGLGPVYADAGISYNPSTNALTVGTLTETSTIELKQNIRDFVTPLAKFMALQPVSYKWKENKRKDIGFIAEHVQELFPEIVAEDGKSMSYTKLTPILIDIVQRQQETIDEMRKELKAIKRHIDKH